MIKLGILGTGKIVQELLPHLDQIPLAQVSLLSTEHSRERAQALVEQYHLHAYFVDYDELLASDVNTIYVALPNHLHFAFAKQALQHGKHVICEKPMTSNVEELKTLMQLARQNGVMLLEAMTLYHLPAYQAMRCALASVEPVKLVSFNYSQYSSRYDAFRQGMTPPVFDCEKSGGALMDINVYNIHAMIGLFGKPQRVQYHANITRGIDTSGMLLCEYPDFQAVCIGAKDCASKQQSVIEGETATISIEGPLSCMTRFEVQHHDGTNEVYADRDAPYRMIPEFRTFVRILENADQTACDRLLQYSLMAAEVMEEARKSAGIHFPCDKF